MEILSEYHVEITEIMSQFESSLMSEIEAFGNQAFVRLPCLHACMPSCHGYNYVRQMVIASDSVPSNYYGLIRSDGFSPSLSSVSGLSSASATERQSYTGLQTKFPF